MSLFFCKGVHHQFQPVFLIGFAGAGVAVQRKEYGFRISHMELVDHAFSRDVVRQAAEGLEADDAAASMMEKICHVSGEEPSFAGAVAEREEPGGSFGQPRDIGNLVETFGNFDCFFQRAAVPFQKIAAKGIFQVVAECAVQVLPLKMAV